MVAPAPKAVFRGHFRGNKNKQWPDERVGCSKHAKGKFENTPAPKRGILRYWFHICEIPDACRTQLSGYITRGIGVVFPSELSPVVHISRCLDAAYGVLPGFCTKSQNQMHAINLSRGVVIKPQV
jgi:hypothetical protein